MISQLIRLFEKLISSWSSLLVLGVVFIYLVASYLPSVIGTSPSLLVTYLTTYVPQSLLWGAMAYLVLRLGPVRTGGKPRFRPLVSILAVVCGSLYILLTFLAGMIFGFGKSPSSFSFMGITTNIIYLGAGTLGKEMTRSRLVNSLKRKKLAQVFFGLTLFFSLIEFTPAQIMALHQRTRIIEFFGSSFLPSLGSNALACYLAFLGGPLPAIIYRGMQTAFQWFSPVLPNLPWATKAMLGVFLPLLSVVLVRSLYQAEAREKVRSSREEENPVGWIFTGLIALVFIWFSVGLFPIFPSVIVSGSMTPTIHVGDVVLIRKLPAADLKVGDIAQYRLKNITVNHRIIAIEGSGKNEVFIFKGDANPSADDPVSPQQIIGKQIALIPKIGLVTMAFRKPPSVPLPGGQPAL